MSLPDNTIGRLSDAISPGHSLFAYGTLQFPEVLEVLLGRVPDRAPATAPGWRVAALPGRVYPGLVPGTDSQADGVILSGLTAGEWAILDAFEDDEYELSPIRLADPPDSAWTYIWTSTVTQNNWYPTAFAANHLDPFVTRSAEWRRRL